MAKYKGALRIAIEDFLETFDLGVILYNWYTSLLDKFESELYKVYQNMYNRHPYRDYLPDYLKPEAIVGGTPGHAVQILPIIGAVVLMLLGLFVGSFRPVSNMATYYIDSRVHSARLSPPDAMGMLHRGAINNELLERHLLDTGWSKEIIDAYKKLSEVLLSPLDYINSYRREIITKTELVSKLKQLGMTDETITTLLETTKVIPGVSDLIRMAVREAFSPAVVSKFKYEQDFPADVLPYTRKLGLDDDWVRRYWYAHWELPSPQLGYEMFHRLRPGRTSVTFTKDDLELLLRTADYAPYFRDKMIAISYNPITRVDVRRMYKLGIFDRNEVKERYMDIGYTEEDAEALTEFTVKYEADDGSNIKEKIKDLTLSAATKMYKKQVIDEGDYRERMRMLGYSQDVIDLYVELANMEMSEQVTPDYRQDYVKTMLTDIRKAYNSRMIDEDTARGMMTDLGLPSEQIDYIIAAEDYQADLYDLNDTLKLITNCYVSGAISRDRFISELGKLNVSGAQQQKVVEHVEQLLEWRNKRLTEAQYRTAALKGVITADDYRDALTDLGYTDKDIEILIQLYGIE